jgi:hypothetical protein
MVGIILSLRLCLEKPFLFSSSEGNTRAGNTTRKMSPRKKRGRPRRKRSVSVSVSVRRRESLQEVGESQNPLRNGEQPKQPGT